MEQRNVRFYPGLRLTYEGYPCTVRYVGEVQKTSGKWIGVEWDNPSRGKHAGEHGGVRYFSCKYVCRSKSSTAGSFLRPNRKSDPSATFVQALRQKYASEPPKSDEVDVSNGSLVEKNSLEYEAQNSIRISGKTVEEVGFDKIRQKLSALQDLSIVILDGMRMRRPISRRKKSTLIEGIQVDESANDILETCPKITELDLSRNLFEEWREIVAICTQLRRLRSLRLDGNRFRDLALDEDELSVARETMTRVTSLSLVDTLLVRDQISRVASYFPTLSSLDISQNTLSSLSDALLPNSITVLSLEDNDFKLVADFAPLTKLPNLRQLSLKRNKISSYGLGNTEVQNDTLVFSPTLDSLDVSYNAIYSWDFVNGIPLAFPGLTSLRIANNPLFENLHAPDGKLLTADDGYMLTVARLPHVKTLNYSHISSKERLNSESYYLSLIAAELSQRSESESATIISSHPRYAALADEYGEPSIQRNAPLINPNALASRLMKLHFHLGDSASRAVANTSNVPSQVAVEVPKNLTIYAVLGIVGKSFDILPSKCRLVWETGEWISCAREDAAEEEEWDSEQEKANGLHAGIEGKIPREEEIVPGTRSIGNVVDGESGQADIRVEIR